VSCKRRLRDSAVPPSYLIAEYNFRAVFFKLEEEGNTALLHHLLKLFAETTVFGFAVVFYCRLVVVIVQPRKDKAAIF
jgi:hypothetical protein